MTHAPRLELKGSLKGSGSRDWVVSPRPTATTTVYTDLHDALGPHMSLDFLPVPIEELQRLFELCVLLARPALSPLCESVRPPLTAGVIKSVISRLGLIGTIDRRRVL